MVSHIPPLSLVVVSRSLGCNGKLFFHTKSIFRALSLKNFIMKVKSFLPSSYFFEKKVSKKLLRTFEYSYLLAILLIIGGVVMFKVISVLASIATILTYLGLNLIANDESNAISKASSSSKDGAYAVSVTPDGGTAGKADKNGAGMAHADSYGASASGTDSNGISFESSSK